MIPAIIVWLFTSTIGRAALVALSVVGAYTTGEAVGRHSANKDAEIASLESQLRVAKTDAEITAALHKTVQDRLSKLEDERSGLARQVSDYEQAVSKLEDQKRTCRAASADDVSRLRAIR